MATNFTLPEDAKIIGGAKPAADAAGRSARYISCKQAHKVYAIVYMDQGNAATVALTVTQATDVSGTSAKAITNAARIWANLDVAANGDAITRATDAVSYTTDAGVKEKIIVIEIDPASLDQANGFDCVKVATGASNAANITSVLYFGTPLRYPGVGSPTMLTD
jgi:hypothetical protein